MKLTELTRQHGFKIPPHFSCSVEDCSLAVGEMVGHSNVKSAGRMNGAVVISVGSVEDAELVMENGIERPLLSCFGHGVKRSSGGRLLLNTLLVVDRIQVRDPEQLRILKVHAPLSWPPEKHQHIGTRRQHNTHAVTLSHSVGSQTIKNTCLAPDNRQN